MRVLFIGAPVDTIRPGKYADRYDASGKNTGNLLIGHGLRRQIAYSSYEFGIGRDPVQASEDFDLIAIAAANFIYRGFDFGHFANFIESTTLPVLVVGLGAQMPSNSSAEVDIPEGTRRFIKVISERTAEIGVRGKFTAEVLSKLGITNTRITGCPSYYWNLAGAMPVSKRLFDPLFKVSVNGSRNVFEHSYNPEAARKVESGLIKLSVRHHYDYVLQNEHPEMRVLFEPQLDETARSELATLSKRHELDLSEIEYALYIKDHCKAFFDLDEWIGYIKTKDLSIGSRFHGNLIALLNGVPAILIAHDSRTVEMASFMKIPYHMVHEIDSLDIRTLYERADFDAFLKNYNLNHKNYIEFLVKNGVPHRLTAVD